MMDLFKQLQPTSEDTLHYTVYPPDALQDKVSAASLVARIDSFVSNILPNLLWHRDSLQLKVVPDTNARRGENKYILEGHMRIGDCVDDEWCAVWLLREISSSWDVVIRLFSILHSCFHSYFIPVSTIRMVNFYSSKLQTFFPNG